MATPQGKTADGIETQFGVNHLGHFLLTELLLDTLRETAPSRIVFVASAAHAGIQGQPGELKLDDLDFSEREYEPYLAYNQSKLAVVLYARQLARRLEGTGVSVFSTHPGWVRSNLVKHSMPPWVQNVIMRPFGRFIGLMSAEGGAQTQLHCLLDKPGGWPMRSPNPLVDDDALAERLVEVSHQMVGLSA